MKTISKALIAVMAAAAMCLVPLFAIADDSDAADITTGEKGLSAEAKNVSTENFNKLISNTVKAQILDPLDIGIAVSDVTFKNAEFKIASANKLTSDEGYSYYGSYIKADFTYSKSLIVPVTMFPRAVGLEDLYTYMGTNIAASGGTLKVEGTIEVGKSIESSGTYFKTEGGNIAVSSSEGVQSEYYEATYEVTYNNGSSEKSFEVEMSGNTYDKTVMDLTYEINDQAKAIAATKVLVSNTVTDKGQSSATYKFDGKTGSYESKDVPEKVRGTFYESTAEMFLYDDNLGPEAILYYSDGIYMEEPSLFYDGMVGDASLEDNAKMEAFLKDIGSVSDSYSTAKSIADSCTKDVTASGGSSGNNIVFYIIIGVLAVAVVALAVLMFKKK